MNARKSLTTIPRPDQAFTVHPRAFVFFDKKTGSQRFEAKANPDGTLPVNYVASLLAVHCVMRGQAPNDFGVMVAADEDLLGGLEERAEKLIHDCQMFQSPVRLTKRQKEVLHFILQNLSNKEISGKINISVRTVKFHIAALLVKFGATDRRTLMRKTGGIFSADWVSTQPWIPQLVANAGFASGHEDESTGDRGTQLNTLDRRSRR